MMLHRITSIFFTSIKRCYALSSKRNDDPTGTLPNRTNQGNGESFDRCKETMKQITLEGPIDYNCLESIGLDWSSLPDEDFSHLDSIVNLENQQEPPTKSKESHQSFSSSEYVSSDAGDNRTRYIFSPGEFAILFIQDLGRKRRPVVVLSSSFHNRLHGARVLIVPLSSTVNNTALHRLIISPNDTRHGQVIKTESNILFDYTSMVSPKYLKPTHDGLQYDVLQQTLAWWQRLVKPIMSDV